MEAFAISHLNDIRGRPFIREDRTAFIARVFRLKRRIFADSPILRSLGFEMRSGEPALPSCAAMPSFHRAMKPCSKPTPCGVWARPGGDAPDEYAAASPSAHHHLARLRRIDFLAAPALGVRGTRRRKERPGGVFVAELSSDVLSAHAIANLAVCLRLSAIAATPKRIFSIITSSRPYFRPLLSGS